MLWVRARERPRALEGFIRITGDRETEAFVRGGDVEAQVALERRTRVVGLQRHDAPFLAAGPRLVVTVRECLGNEEEPGLRGLRLVLAEEVRVAAG